MALTAADVTEMLRLLRENPDLQAELRQMIWSAELAALRESIQDLVAAQRSSEERMDRVESALERLAEAQARTEERVEELVQAQRYTQQHVDRLATAFGQLQSAFGSTIEEEAESFVQALLEEKGYRLLAEPHSLAFDGEVDVVMALETPAGDKVWAITEAKARLGYREVRQWAQRMKSSGWHQRLASEGVTGPYLVYAYGIRVDPGAVRAAEEHGIGLMTGRGERVAPKELIREPSD